MAQDPHATVPPVGSLDRVPFLNAARRRLEKMLPNLTEPPSGVPPINYLEPAYSPQGVRISTPLKTRCLLPKQQI